MPYIIVSNDDGEIERRDLRRPIIIGRSSRCDVTLDDKLISRNHCRISALEDTWLVEDLGSHNGTCVNGIEVKRHVLAEGDRIELGEVLIEFHLGPFPSTRPSSPQEARIHAELLREVDSMGSDETMTGVRQRPLPQVHLDAPVSRAPTDRDVMHGSQAAFARPRPEPKIPTGEDASKPAPVSPRRPSLLDRLFRRHRGG